MDAFTTPRTAVEELGRLLAAEDWPALARCYDLSGTDVDPATLQSGAYFLRASDVGHPATKIARPFSPGFTYDSHRDDGADVVVTVSIAIDQGDGMVQRGFQEFRLRKTAAGLKVRP